jgi:hypothetical protein
MEQEGVATSVTGLEILARAPYIRLSASDGRVAERLKALR